MTRIASTLGLGLALAAGMAFGGPECRKTADCELKPGSRCPAPDQVPVQVQSPSVEVVFVLDTTGSMGGLIEGAKQRIWSIASHIAGAQPAPTVRMGLVGYRDRGDQYVTKQTALTDDLDALYAELMQFQASGGGDTPESVNQALFEAIDEFDWSTDDGTLRLVYLVGDAPPKMGYQDDVKYLATCKIARKHGVIINTIQCGNIGDTGPIWQEIAQHAGGQFTKVVQSGGAVAVPTPYDEQISVLNVELNATMIFYGAASDKLEQKRKRSVAAGLERSMSSTANADRAIYNQSKAGRRNLYGSKELVNDLDEGKTALKDVPVEELPEPMQAMNEGERQAHIDTMNAMRLKINAQIAELGKKRVAFLREHKPAASKDGFDAWIIETLSEQGASKGLKIADE